jgi:TonB family protein
MIKKNLIICFALFLMMFLFGTVNAQDNNQTEKPKDRPLKILKRDFPRDMSDCPKSTGTVRVKVTFDKSETISNVELVSSSGCNSFDNKAIASSKKIKFKPAIKDGEAITVTKTVEYQYNRY